MYSLGFYFFFQVHEFMISFYNLCLFQCHQLSPNSEARGMDFRTQIVLRLAFPCAGRAGLWTDFWEGGNVTEGRSRNNCNFYFILCYFVDIRPPKTEHFRLDCIAIVFYLKKKRKKKRNHNTNPAMNLKKIQNRTISSLFKLAKLH